MDDNNEIANRLEAIEQALNNGFAALIATLLRPKEERDTVTSVQFLEAATTLRQCAKALGYTAH